MVITTRLRMLRLKYNVTLTELARVAGISNQRLSDLERGRYSASPELQLKISRALGRLIDEKKNSISLLANEYRAYKECLLTPVEVESDEL